MKVTFAHVLAYSVVILAASFSNYQSWTTAKEVERNAAVQSAALVSSTRQVAKDGCDRDNTNQEHFRGLLTRLKESSKQSYRAGRTTPDQYRESQAFYVEQLRIFRVVNCEAAGRQITDRP